MGLWVKQLDGVTVGVQGHGKNHGHQGCGRVGIRAKALWLEQASGEKSGEALRSEHRTHVCAKSPGLGTVTLCSRQTVSSDALQDSAIYSFTCLSLHFILYSPKGQDSGDLMGKRPVSWLGLPEVPIHPSICPTCSECLLCAKPRVLQTSEPVLILQAPKTQQGGEGSRQTLTNHMPVCSLSQSTFESLQGRCGTRTMTRRHSCPW